MEFHKMLLVFTFLGAVRGFRSFLPPSFSFGLIILRTMVMATMRRRRKALPFPHTRYYPKVFLVLFLCSSSFFMCACGGGGVVLSSTIPPFHQGISLGLSMGRIAVIGAINADITVRVSTLPTPGETVTSLSPRTSMAVGGKGAPIRGSGGTRLATEVWQAAARAC